MEVKPFGLSKANPAPGGFCFITLRALPSTSVSNMPLKCLSCQFYIELCLYLLRLEPLLSDESLVVLCGSKALDIILTQDLAICKLQLVGESREVLHCGRIWTVGLQHEWLMLLQKHHLKGISFDKSFLSTIFVEVLIHCLRCSHILFDFGPSE